MCGCSGIRMKLFNAACVLRKKKRFEKKFNKIKTKIENFLGAACYAYQIFFIRNFCCPLSPGRRIPRRNPRSSRITEEKSTPRHRGRDTSAINVEMEKYDTPRASPKYESSKSDVKKIEEKNFSKGSISLAWRRRRIDGSLCGRPWRSKRTRVGGRFDLNIN